MHCDHASLKLLPLHSEGLLDLGTKEVVGETLRTHLLSLKRYKQFDEANEKQSTAQMQKP